MLFTTALNHALARFGLHERGNGPFLRQPVPMLLERAKGLFHDSAWTYEPKWDGFRMLATVRERSVRLTSRNGHSFTNLFWPVSDALRSFPTSVVLDGEVVAINNQGRPDFEVLQQRLRPRNGKLPGYLCFMVFDLLHANGHSLLSRPLEERQAILWELQPALQSDTVKLTEGFPRRQGSASHEGLRDDGARGRRHEAEEQHLPARFPGSRLDQGPHPSSGGVRRRRVSRQQLPSPQFADSWATRPQGKPSLFRIGWGGLVQ